MNYVLKKELFLEYNYICENVFVDKTCLIDILKELQTKILSFIKHDDSISVDLRSILDKFTTDELTSFIFVFEEVLVRLNYNVNYKLLIDYMFSRLNGGDNDD